MPDRATVQRARRDLRRGRSASTAAGEFVREEMHHIREGKHGARSTRQAIAIGLSKARRAGVPLRPPGEGSARTRRAAETAYAAGQKRARRSRSSSPGPSPRRSRASRSALRREPRRAASPRALAAQAHAVATRRGPRARSESARRAARTKGPALRKAAARKAAATRERG